MTENNNNSKNNNCQQSSIDIELKVLDEITDEHCNNWYNRVYLCYEDVSNHQPNDSLAITGFNCYRYNSFKNADKGWWNDRTEFNKINIRHTMIPICRWVPSIFDKYILNWKLKNMYWKGNIWIGQGYNRYTKK